MNTRVPRLIEDLQQQRRQGTLRSPAQAGAGVRLPGLRDQAGSMLLEAFIAILIFSMGILAIVGMQASAIKTSADAKYRSEASLLANELIGQMWVSNRTTATLQANFQSGGGTPNTYTTWYAGFNDANGGPTSLPGSSVYPPTVTINPATGLVTIQVFWLPPNEAASQTPHNYTVTAQIQG
jgi:type IV pilus assembly protein PilV